MLKSYKWMGWMGWDWKSLSALILRAPLCGANNPNYLLTKQCPLELTTAYLSHSCELRKQLSLQHDQCNSGKLRVTQAMDVAHALQSKTNSAIEVTGKCDKVNLYIYRQKSPEQM